MSRFSSVVRITGITLGVDWLDDVHSVPSSETLDQVRAGDRLGLGAMVAFELSPDAAKGCQRPTIVESE
jgi:hypothetical protein